MTTYIALLRGINVGGNNPMPMNDLRETLASLGCKDVRTYIQSGNAVFASNAAADALRDKILSAIEKKFSFRPKLLMLSVERFAEIVATNPFTQAEKTPKLLHVLFLADKPRNPDLDKLTATKTKTEKFSLGENAFYLYAPDGLGRSKLAAKVEKCLGVDATGRNWRTVVKILELASPSGGKDN